MKAIEYHEGDEALSKFEKTMTTLFRAPKTVVKEKPKPMRTPKKTSKG